MKAMTLIRIGILGVFAAAAANMAWAQSLIKDNWCEPISPQHTEGPAAYLFTVGYVRYDLISGSFKELDKKVKAWKNPDCVWNDGRPIMFALLAGYSEAFDDLSDWSAGAIRVEKLRKEYPRTNFAALAEAQYWVSYAWNARGTGYSSSVTKEGWKLFNQRLEKAEAILIESKPYADDLPGWYELMMRVQKYLGRPANEIDKVFIEGTEKFRKYFRLHTTMGLFMLPKWGGNWDMFDRLVKWSVDKTKEAYGISLYARLYMFAHAELQEGEDLFKVTKASWPQMRRGFEDLMKLTPKSIWNLNSFAAFSCMAGDKKTYLVLRKKIGVNTIEQAWEAVSLDLCDRKYGHAG